MAETYNPILSIENLAQQGLLSRPPIPEPGQALVFSGNGRPLKTLVQGEKSLTWGETRFSYNLLHKIDMTDHPLRFQCNIPCQGESFHFAAEVAFRCAVRDPEIIVKRNITDVAQWIKDSVENSMRIIGRQYDIRNSSQAEEQMSAVVNKEISEFGFHLSKFTLKLSLPSDALAWIKEQRRIQEQNELEKLKSRHEHERKMQELQSKIQQQQLEQMLKKQQEEFELFEIDKTKQDWEIQKGQYDHERKMQELQAKIQQQQLEQEYKRKQEQFDLQMLEQKTNFYSTILQSGNLQLLALQLSQNPQDVQAILQALNQQKQADRAYQIQVLQTLINADVLEGWQLTDVGKRALQELFGSTEQSTPALEDNTSNPQKNSENSSKAVEVNPTTPSEPNWEDDEG